jgi:hypothetical protein
MVAQGGETLRDDLRLDRRRCHGGTVRTPAGDRTGQEGEQKDGGRQARAERLRVR